MNVTQEQAEFIVEVLVGGMGEAISHDAAIQRALISSGIKPVKDESINEGKLRAKAEWLANYLNNLI